MNLKKINKRINLLCEKTNKFKTFSISFYFHNELREETASLNALLPYVLKMGSKNYKDMTIISNTLEDLYGGNFDCSVVKKGENQIVGFNFEFVSPEYIKNDSKYMDKVYSFIFDIIFNPLAENGGFLSEYVSREKENMIDYIEGIINDKKEYAQLRCMEEMCKGENYSVFKYGSIEKIKEITPESLYEHYGKFISEGRIDIFVIGNIETDILEEKIKALSLSDKDASYPATALKLKCDKVKEIEDRFDVAQGKISLGFRTNVTSKSPEKYALTVFNSIYGSGAHSKLFNNVREKLSLCYYAYSRIDSFKGIMCVNSGVEFKNFKMAYDEMLIQLNDIREGKIEEYEMDSAKKSLINALSSIKDSHSSIEDYMLNGLINGNIIEISDYIDNIRKVTKDDVVNVAEKIELDTVYYLKNV